MGGREPALLRLEAPRELSIWVWRAEPELSKAVLPDLGCDCAAGREVLLPLPKLLAAPALLLPRLPELA